MKTHDLINTFRRD